MKQGRASVSIASIVLVTLLTGCVTGTIAAEEEPPAVSEMVIPEREAGAGDDDTVTADTDNVGTALRPTFFTKQYSPDVVQDNPGADVDALPELQEEYEAEQERIAEEERLEQERLEEERLAAEREAKAEEERKEAERKAAEEAAREAEQVAEREAAAQEEAAESSPSRSSAYQPPKETKQSSSSQGSNSSTPPPSPSPSPKASPAPTPPADSRSVKSMAEDTLAKHGCDNVPLRWDSSVASGRFSFVHFLDGRMDWGKVVIQLNENIDREVAELLAAHECAHYLQYRTYGNRYELVDDMNSLHSWGGTMANGQAWPDTAQPGLEINAHCITELWGYDTTRSAYWGDCSAEELGYAQKIADGQRLR